MTKPGKPFALFVSIGTTSKAGRWRKLRKRCPAASKMFWDWAARAYAYDCYADELNRAEQARERRAMRRRQAEAGAQLQEIATEGLAELARRMVRGQPLDLSVEQICRLAEVGSRLERLARGEGSVQNRYQKIEVVIAESLKEYDDDDVAGQNF